MPGYRSLLFVTAYTTYTVSKYRGRDRSYPIEWYGENRGNTEALVKTLGTLPKAVSFPEDDL